MIVLFVNVCSISFAISFAQRAEHREAIGLRCGNCTGTGTGNGVICAARRQQKATNEWGEGNA